VKATRAIQTAGVSALADLKPRGAGAALLSIGTATPRLRHLQHDIAKSLAARWRLPPHKLQRWERIIAGSGVEGRHGIAPIEQILRAGTEERMRLYQQHAPNLAEQAARAAMASAGVAPWEISDLIIVSCTGFFAPGVDVALVDQLHLPRTVRRNTVGFMGCFGAITGLRAAIGACAAAPASDSPATALVVCVELCSLHVRDSIDDDNLVASALFGDGAAAAVVRQFRGDEDHDIGAPNLPERNAPGMIEVGASLLSSGGRVDMTWRITDAGFAMTIDPSVPRAIESLAPAALAAAGIDDPADMDWIVHPGGPRILDAVESALSLPDGALDPSRSILRTHGNMSSATVLFVLEAMLHAGPLRPQAAILAFGPGLTIEVMPIRRIGWNRTLQKHLASS